MAKLADKINNSIELVRAHANAILELTDRVESSTRNNGILDTIEHHTSQIDALLKTARERGAKELLINILLAPDESSPVDE